jgi:hypothetical protein
MIYSKPHQVTEPEPQGCSIFFTELQTQYAFLQHCQEFLMATVSVLKRQCHKIFNFRFLKHKILTGPQIRDLQYFRILLGIRRDIVLYI